MGARRPLVLLLSIVLAFLCFLAAAVSAYQRPSQGKVRIYVAADVGVYEGVQQKAADLEARARDLRVRLDDRKWLEVTENEEDADLILRIVGQRIDAVAGRALGYALDAGAYKTEDEFLYAGESVRTGGGRTRDAQSMSDRMDPRKTLGWGELAKRFADSLEEFAESNYTRIMAQRPER